MNEKEKYLNDLMNKKIYSGPKYLYKYRPFDAYTFDMLENNYVWLSKVSSLDDPTECKVTVKEENYYDLVNDTIRKEVVEQLLEFIKQYSSKEANEKIKSIIYKCMTNDYHIKNNYLLEAAFDIKEFAPELNDEMIVNLVNWLANIPKMVDDPQIKPQIESLLLAGLEAREKMGICSLADSSNNELLWKNYASDDTGYCIEYEIDNYDHNDWLFPVDYVEERQTNLVIQLVKSFIGQFINQLSNNQLSADRTSYLRLFITKDIKWNYQNEWRLLGDANTKLNAPKIKKIVLGKNTSDENEMRIKKYCLTNSIAIEERNTK